MFGLSWQQVINPTKNIWLANELCTNPTRMYRNWFDHICSFKSLVWSTPIENNSAIHVMKVELKLYWYLSQTKSLLHQRCFYTQNTVHPRYETNIDRHKNTIKLNISEDISHDPQLKPVKRHSLITSKEQCCSHSVFQQMWATFPEITSTKILKMLAHLWNETLLEGKKSRLAISHSTFLVLNECGYCLGCHPLNNFLGEILNLRNSHHPAWSHETSRTKHNVLKSQKHLE